MNYKEAEDFVKNNSENKIAETLVQQAETIKSLKSQINGDEYWLKFYCGQLLSNPDFSQVHPSIIVIRAENVLDEVNNWRSKRSY